MEHEYSVKKLLEKFKKHADKYDNDLKPYDPEYECSKEDYGFNISRALETICREIIQCKEK